MSGDSSDFLPGYGLRDEMLEQIIEQENLSEITSRFSRRIDEILSKFDTKMRIRIFEFDETSSFRDFAFKGIFYHCLLSNKNCCVILKFKHRQLADITWINYLLAHEFAHHFQFTSGFPFLIPKPADKGTTELLTYVEKFIFGPENGSIWVDGKRYNLAGPTEDLQNVLQDFGERIMDDVCDWFLLRDRNLLQGFKEFYLKDREQIPVTAHYPVIGRYIRRLMLFDTANNQSLIETVFFPDNRLKKLFKRDRKKVIELNKGFPKAEEAFYKIGELLNNTDFVRFKDSAYIVSRIKNYLTLLNITIRTAEKW